MVRTTKAVTGERMVLTGTTGMRPSVSSHLCIYMQPTHIFCLLVDPDAGIINFYQLKVSFCFYS